jgi:hypothetical protein
MIDSTPDIKNFASQKALKRLQELSQSQPEVLDFKVDGSVWRNGNFLLEEPSDDQKEWVLFRLSHSNTWPKVHENKKGDSKNWT